VPAVEKLTPHQRAQAQFVLATAVNCTLRSVDETTAHHVVALARSTENPFLGRPVPALIVRGERKPRIHARGTTRAQRSQRRRVASRGGPTRQADDPPERDDVDVARLALWGRS
jgi:hypothetical protein